MKYLGFYSAEMQDLLSGEERKRLEKFASLLVTAVKEKIPSSGRTPRLSGRPSRMFREQNKNPISTGTKKIVILTDDDGSSPNLAAMTDRLLQEFFRFRRADQSP